MIAAMLEIAMVMELVLGHKLALVTLDTISQIVELVVDWN